MDAWMHGCMSTYNHAILSFFKLKLLLPLYFCPIYVITIGESLNHKTKEVIWQTILLIYKHCKTR